MTKTTLYTGIAVAVALIVVGIFFILGVPFNTSSIDNSQAVVSDTGAAAPAGQLMAQDEVVGTGPKAMPGDTVVASYTGTLADGTVFDSSAGKAAAPTCPQGTATGFCFTLGAGQVIPGWDQGLVGMQAGGKRMLVVPPSLAYGSQGIGPIPPNATLTFEIQLIKIIPASAAQ